MIPKNSSGNPIHCRSQPSVTCSSSVMAGPLFQTMPFPFKAAVSISPRMPGWEPEFAK
jgi:hypothetical protein